MPEYLIRLPWPSNKLSSNARGHWAIKAKAVKDARHAAFVLAREQLVRDPMPDAKLVFTYSPPDNRRRDAQNIPHMIKAYIDGIADAMGCDDHGFEVVYPARFDEPVKGGCILCHIIPKTVVIEHRGTIK